VSKLVNVTWKKGRPGFGGVEFRYGLLPSGKAWYV
jgi:hypothetical protein